MSREEPSLIVEIAVLVGANREVIRAKLELDFVVLLSEIPRVDEGVFQQQWDRVGDAEETKFAVSRVCLCLNVI